MMFQITCSSYRFQLKLHFTIFCDKLIHIQYTHINAYIIHTYVHTHIRTYIHTYIHTHTYFSTYIRFQILPLCNKNRLAFGRLWAPCLSTAWLLWQRFVHLFLGPSRLISGSYLKSCNDRSILYHFHFNIYQSSCNSTLCKLSNWMQPCVNLQEQRKRSRVFCLYHIETELEKSNDVTGGRWIFLD